MGETSLSFLGDKNLAADFLVLCLLQSFCTLICNLPSDFNARVTLQMFFYYSWAPHDQLFPGVWQMFSVIVWVARKTLWWEVTDILIREKVNKHLECSLEMCWFNKALIDGSLRSTTLLSHVSGSGFHFSSVEQTISQIRQLLGTTRRQCHCYTRNSAMLAIAVVPGNHSWVGLLVSSHTWKLTRHSPVLWKLDLRQEAFKSLPAQVIWVPSPKFTVSSAIATPGGYQG